MGQGDHPHPFWAFSLMGRPYFVVDGRFGRRVEVEGGEGSQLSSETA